MQCTYITVHFVSTYEALNCILAFDNLDGCFRYGGSLTTGSLVWSFDGLVTVLWKKILIYSKNFICYTATVQQATFRTDLDLRQAGLGLPVQFRILNYADSPDEGPDRSETSLVALLHCCCVTYEVFWIIILWLDRWFNLAMSAVFFFRAFRGENSPP